MDSATSKATNIDHPVMEWRLNNQASTHEQHREEGGGKEWSKVNLWSRNYNSLILGLIYALTLIKELKGMVLGDPLHKVASDRYRWIREICSF